MVTIAARRGRMVTRGMRTEVFNDPRPDDGEDGVDDVGNGEDPGSSNGGVGAAYHELVD